MKIKTGVGILALSALTTMMISAPLSPKLKKVNWLSGSTATRAITVWPRSVKNLSKTPALK
ncbi:maltose ABC transporter periplasmic protein [Salmonella enterica subsp. enterica serovar Saintpaul str. S-70]|nr:maltose ABC transporter periplasmic protein [Salmonella enterica subsp. enterica serovar Saintpaul str. S-70]